MVTAGRTGPEGLTSSQQEPGDQELRHVVPGNGSMMEVTCEDYGDFVAHALRDLHQAEEALREAKEQSGRAIALYEEYGGELMQYEPLIVFNRNLHRYFSTKDTKP